VQKEKKSPRAQWVVEKGGRIQKKETGGPQKTADVDTRLGSFEKMGKENKKKNTGPATNSETGQNPKNGANSKNGRKKRSQGIIDNPNNNACRECPGTEKRNQKIGVGKQGGKRVG